MDRKLEEDLTFFTQEIRNGNPKFTAWYFENVYRKDAQERIPLLLFEKYWKKISAKGKENWPYQKAWANVTSKVLKNESEKSVKAFILFLCEFISPDVMVKDDILYFMYRTALYGSESFLKSLLRIFKKRKNHGMINRDGQRSIEYAYRSFLDWGHYEVSDFFLNEILKDIYKIARETNNILPVSYDDLNILGIHVDSIALALEEARKTLFYFMLDKMKRGFASDSYQIKLKEKQTYDILASFLYQTHHRRGSKYLDFVYGNPETTFLGRYTLIFKSKEGLLDPLSIEITKNLEYQITNDDVMLMKEMGIQLTDSQAHTLSGMLSRKTNLGPILTKQQRKGTEPPSYPVLPPYEDDPSSFEDTFDGPNVGRPGQRRETKHFTDIRRDPDYRQKMGLAPLGQTHKAPKNKEKWRRSPPPRFDSYEDYGPLYGDGPATPSYQKPGPPNIPPPKPYRGPPKGPPKMPPKGPPKNDGPNWPPGFGSRPYVYN